MNARNPGSTTVTCFNIQFNCNPLEQNWWLEHDIVVQFIYALMYFIIARTDVFSLARGLRFGHIYTLCMQETKVLARLHLHMLD